MKAIFVDIMCAVWCESVQEQCEHLGVKQSIGLFQPEVNIAYYYKAVEPVSEVELGEIIKRIFLESKSRYGARKIKKYLENDGITLSRRWICRIMKKLNLVSVYQKAPLKTKDYVHR